MSVRCPFASVTFDWTPHSFAPRKWCNEWWTWTKEWNYIMFTDESRFCLEHLDGRIRVFEDTVIEFLPRTAYSPGLSPMENVWSMLEEGLTRDTPPSRCYTRSTLAICGSSMNGCTPRMHPKPL
ncbi:hypothetical protein TNCV_3440691 [Trichonephila clavipes]|uniref:Tc1-like transposase DDE domain-containing protein n=1 Tax=Trichonephila clavipes TaxID=2585209 RepID=A0A8X6W5K2_TRICX|nr:hypothetical protein TNCV_3440691 [Trichonephila clavipes]